MKQLKGQLSLRGVLIGAVGCIIITATSVYTALKMGALPWPIIFAAIISLFFLKALGKTNLNEVNVTHTIMSAGAMVAGGLAFTIPGIWIIGAGEVEVFEMLVVALAGVILGLMCTAVLRKHFIEDAQLEFPIGTAAAQTIIAGDKGGKTGLKLLASMGFAGIYTALRDWFATVPALLLSNISIPGVAFGIYNSPMLLAVGFLVGTASVVVWFLGALFGNFGIIVGGSSLGWWNIETGQNITASLGMGVMMGCGVGVILKNAIPRIFKKGKPESKSSPAVRRAQASQREAEASTRSRFKLTKLSAGIMACGVAAVALALCFFLGLEPLPCLIVVVLAWVTTAMSAQSVGQTGIDPMEIFGLIVLLLVAAVSGTPQVQLFFVAGVIAVACGLAGDVMNDFKAGHILGTDPRAQWVGQAIGGVIGAIVAVAVLSAMVAAYGTDAFGLGNTFVAAQASMVATMVAGIPSVPAFVIGLIAGCVLYLVGLPVMMLGLGIYLPFYMSFAAFLGALAKVGFNAINRFRARNKSDTDKEGQQKADEETGLIVASGLLGGESIVGVLIAFASVVIGLSG